MRMVASPGLIALAMMGQLTGFVALLVFLVFTEWFDGFLARRLNEVSMTGARLDTVADAIFYSSLLVALTLLNTTAIAREAYGIAAAIGSYLVSWLVSWIKFHRLPSYHTWMAKGVWIVMGLGLAFLLSGWSVWPFRVALICVVVTNLEATCITLILSESRVDVPSIWHVLRNPSQS